jgi:acyl carrier protein
MNDQDVLRELNGIFIDVLDDDEISVSMSTTAEDVEDWDSLTHITLVSALENKYGLSFSLAELEKLSNVGDMVALIKSKME